MQHNLGTQQLLNVLVDIDDPHDGVEATYRRVLLEAKVRATAHDVQG